LENAVFRYTITDDMVADLDRLAAHKETLDLRGPLPRRWLGRLRRELQASSIAASTSMEGVPVTVQEVRRLLAGDRPPGVSPDDAALVLGYRSAMEYALRRADSSTLTWGDELLLAVQDRVLAGAYPRAGRFREGPVYIRDGATGETRFHPPAAPELTALVDELMQWALDSKDPVPVRSAFLHAGVAAIHPFADGNGRTARVIAALEMYRGGYRAPEFTSLEEWWGNHLADYYAAFRCLGIRWDPAADVTPFLAVHVHAQLLQVESLSLRQKTERAIWQTLEETVTIDLKGPVRLADALFDAFMCRPVSNRYYREIADIEVAMASNDLARLHSAGVLEAIGAGRSRTYVGAPRLYSLVAGNLGLADDVDADAPPDRQRDAIIVRIAQRLAKQDEFTAREWTARWGTPAS
jgi:Fic family protein